MKVLVLGAGPAGLLSCHAAASHGVQADIITMSGKSPIRGAQYIDRPIQNLCMPSDASPITFRMAGSSDEYSRKVYGEVRKDVSWHRYCGQEGTGTVAPGWSMNYYYSKLWSAYSWRIVTGKVDLTELSQLSVKYDVVISTVPLNQWFPEACLWQEVWIKSEPLSIGEIDEDNVIVYSGDEEDPWYRMSTLFGWRSYEYGSMEAAVEGGMDDIVVRVSKPLGLADWFSTEEYLPSNVLCVGRYGSFRKKELVGDAFDTVYAAMEALK